ncbi:MAG TPA: bifunctional oligoribonuclease/PAP phosphatase NrnA, partial [Nitrospirota bacterium]|nr:bifunctional oligoribonuclease/PAP phosphatase NrnA [Nitrospirota bacterium]
MNDSLSDIVTALKKAGTVLISVHKNPDGDALGSQIGLMVALEKLGKKVTAHNLDPVPEIYRFLPHADRVNAGRPVQGAYDALVVLDSDPPRTGLFDDRYPAKTLINVDHHMTNTRIWPLTWLDPDASATGEMIHTMVARLGVPLDREIALCLYTAIFTDTGSYRYSNTTAKCMRISADLLGAGADPWLVTENVYESFAYKRIKFLGQVLADMARSEDGRIAWVVITEELYRASGTSAEDTENFINFVRSVKDVEVAVLFRQTAAAQYKVSFRSKG